MSVSPVGLLAFAPLQKSGCLHPLSGLYIYSEAVATSHSMTYYPGNGSCI